MPSASEINYATLHSPRILCLHGGGTNAEILKLQARTYIPRLSPHFRLVFADAPFCCDPHPAILPVYEDFGPFRLWSRWRTDQAVCGNAGEDGEGEAVLLAWEEQMRAAMEIDDAEGATGEWVGLLGFSQGARVAGSMLFESQLRMEKVKESWPWGGPPPVPEGFAGGRWQFGVLMAGRGPWIALSEEGEQVNGVALPGGLLRVMEMRTEDERGEGKLKLPTVHVHGFKDTGLPFMRQMLDFDCERENVRLVEWDGDHRLAFKNVDVEPVVQEIFKIAVQLGILDISDPSEA